MRKIIVDPKIFEQFPDFKRGVIIVSDIENEPSNEAIQKLLDAELKAKTGADLIKSENVIAWDEAHRKFGSNPNKYLPSVKSLLERVQKGKGLPFISSVVAAFNYISLKYLIPCGGDDLDIMEGDLRLDFAKGDEKFRAIGATEDDNPISGEVIYFDTPSRRVMCRRWNWRNGDFAKISEKTKKIVINIDGVGAISGDIVKEARDEMAEILKQHCSAVLTTDYLDKDKRETDIDL